MSSFDDLDIGGEFYGEIRVEDQDLRLLKALVTDDQAARELSQVYDHSLFVGDARPFAEKAMGYFKTYSQLPTKRVMLDQAKEGNNFFEEFEQIWEKLDSAEYKPTEFHYDLDKVKNRFAKHQVAALKDNLPDFDSDVSVDEVLRKARANLDKAEKVLCGREEIYTQKTLKAYMPEFRDMFVQKSKNPTLGQGILTGFSYIDFITNGLQSADMVIIGGETGAGKAQRLQTLIPTPFGFRKMGDIKPGDQVLGRNGKPCNVVAESKIFNDPGWKFIFNDGSEVVSHDNHEWLTFDRKEQVALSKRTPEFRAKRKAKRKSRAIKNTRPWLTKANKNREHELKPTPEGTIRTSSEIAETLFVGKNKRKNHAIPIASAIELPKKDLLIDPYLFGCWLGDGTSKDGQITSMDLEIKQAIYKSGYKIGAISTNKNKDGILSKASSYRMLGLSSDLRKVGVFGNKHIPHDYLWASKEQRLALLQGLMDTDGFASKKGHIDFVNTNEKIAEGVAHLVRSLGEKCTVTKGEAKLYGIVTGPKWTVRFAPSFPAFRLSRKFKRQVKSPRLNKFRYIKEAVRIPAVPMKCIQVDSEDHLYLCTKYFIPTHNSMLLANMAKQMWMQNNTIEQRDNFTKGYNILYFSLEMPYEQCVRRTMASMSSISTYALRDCQITDDKQLARLADTANFIKAYPYEFDIVDIPRGVTVEQIEERFLEAVAKGHRPDVVVVDYLGLMDAPDEEGDDWLRMAKIAGKLHEFARTYNIVLLSAVQLNRPKSRDPRDTIGLHRIGRSSGIMHHATIGIQILTRENEGNYSDLEYHIIKNRNGETGSHNIKKHFQTATLIDIVDDDGNSYVPPKSDGIGGFVNANVMEDISDRLEKLDWL